MTNRLSSKLINCQERPNTAHEPGIHPGWIHATEILMRGLERLRAEKESRR